MARLPTAQRPRSARAAAEADARLQTGSELAAPDDLPGAGTAAASRLAGRPSGPAANVWDDAIARAGQANGQHQPAADRPRPVAAPAGPPIQAARTGPLAWLLSRLPSRRQWAFALGVGIPALWLATHDRLTPPPAPPDQPVSQLPPRAVAPGLPDPAASGVVVLDNGRASAKVDSLIIDTTPDLAALTADAPGDFYWSVRNPKTDFLSELNIVYFDAHTDLGDIDGRPDAVRYQLEQAYAAIVLQKGAVLTCGYWTGQDVGRTAFYRYWYRFRPAQADPARVGGIDPRSPLLKIASPQDHCPPNRLQARWASDVPEPKPYDFNRDVPGSASWDTHKGVWH